MATDPQETCFWSGELERGLGGLLVKMVLHQWFSETHEKMKQLHFSPWYKNISRASLFHISILRGSLSSQVIGHQTNEKMRLGKANSRFAG